MKREVLNTKKTNFNKYVRTKKNSKVKKIITNLNEKGVNKKIKKGMRTALTIQQLNNIYKTKNIVNTNNTNNTLYSRFKVHKILGDGNCLFRSIAQGINMLKKKEILPISKETEEASLLRKIAIKEVCKRGGNTKPGSKSPLTYKQSILTELKYEYNYNKPNAFKTYCDCQINENNKCYPQRVFKWGGFNEIVALSKKLNIRIVVYVRENRNKYEKIIINQNNSRKTINITLVGNMHYNVLFPKNH